ncbi:MAG: hypothetical protein AAF587_37030 [Bacteroidota bacterium]
MPTSVPYYKILNPLLFLITGLFLLSLYRTAWISDDAYISYRSIENVVNGYGLTYNPGQRVQAFTHPLWAFLHIPFRMLFQNMYVIGLTVSLGTSLAAVGLLVFRFAQSIQSRVFLLIALMSSAAFMDYSSSGLENPLTNLLLVLFAWISLSGKDMHHRLIWGSVLAGLMLLNRMDSILLITPMLFMLWWEQRSLRASGIVLLGLLPFLLWEVFAVIYYGFPFPMTAYAKLNISIERTDLLLQGLHYVIDTAQHDPLTLIVIAAAIIAPFCFKRSHLYPLSFGIACYLLYTVHIGGDFMRGRFFASPFFLSVIVLCRMIRPRQYLYLIPVGLSLGLLGSCPPLLSDADLGKEQVLGAAVSGHGITNEREYYFQGTGLIAAKGRQLPDLRWVNTGKSLRQQSGQCYLTSSIGFIGYFAGPENHVIDRYALTDPFLAQLPNVYQPNWRPGHNKRLIPRGYISSLEQGQNLLISPELGKVYKAIQQITRGPIWSWKRFQTIWEINCTDTFSKLIDREYYTLPVSTSFSEDEISSISQQGMQTHQDAGFEIRLHSANPIKQIHISLQNDCEYTCIFRLEEKIVSSRVVSRYLQDQGMSKAVIPAPQERIDNIVIYPNNQNAPCQVRGIRIER